MRFQPKKKRKGGRAVEGYWHPFKLGSQVNIRIKMDVVPGEENYGVIGKGERTRRAIGDGVIVTRRKFEKNHCVFF